MAKRPNRLVAENPLVPHALLLRLWRLARVLEPGRRRKAGNAPRSPSQVVVRACCLLLLEPGDLLCDLSGQLTAGEIERIARALPAPAAYASSLPLPGTPAEQGFAAVGAAATLRLQGKKRLLLLLLEHGTLRQRPWKGLLAAAVEAAAPMVLVVLPSMEQGTGRDAGRLSAGSQGMGVPGIPVDAADGIALLRVLQESVVRARAGDGPALLEAIAVARLEGSRWGERGVLTDLRAALLARGVPLPRTRGDAQDRP